MYPVLDGPHIQAWDTYTIREESISSSSLMDRAVVAIYQWLTQALPPPMQGIYVICGTGNNGGDGLGVALMLHEAGYKVTVWQSGPARSHDAKVRESLLLEQPELHRYVWPEVPPTPCMDVWIIDALLGSGLKGKLKTPFDSMVHAMNHWPGYRISVDMPTGVPTYGFVEGDAFQAHITLSLQCPKHSFFLRENSRFIGDFHLVDIGLHPGYLSEEAPDAYLLEAADVSSLIKPADTYAHKGDNGHALLISGGHGKMGAAILAGRAALRSGCGRLTIHLPESGNAIMQTALPEAMTSVDPHEYCWSTLPSLDHYQAIGIGCGIGVNEISASALHATLQVITCPLVLDADALNILGLHPEFMDMLPDNAILTPHPGEFRRLVPDATDSMRQVKALRKFCRDHRVVIVLKGAFTRIGFPDGRIFYNPTGNPGMATAGSGDVLTGMITGLLAQGYTAQDAAVAGVYLHGLAGDRARNRQGCSQSVIAGDIVEQIGKAFCSL